MKHANRIRSRLGPPVMLLATAAALAVVFAYGPAGVDGASGPSAASDQPLFTRGVLAAPADNYTTLAFGPDDRLYVASRNQILALTLEAGTHAILDTEEIAAGLEGVLGIAFDPTSPVLAVYASRQDEDATPGYQGAVSRFAAPSWEPTDVITGLPSSAPLLNHMTNGLAFDSDGRLFIAQGSNTDAGIPDPPGTELYWPESPLSAAILVADIHAPGFDGALTYDPPGEPVDHNVALVSGDVSVYAPGLRNPYDLVIHSNGHIYATDNGAVGGQFSLTCTETADGSSNRDELNLIEEGNYYGFPNRNRGLADERQCAYHPPDEATNGGYTAPIAVLPRHCSCDGIVEYTSSAFNNAMRGDLIYVELTRGNIIRAVLSADGRVVEETATLAADFNWPLDVTVAADGTLFIAEFLGKQVSFLAPVPKATPTPTATHTATPTPTATPTATATPAGPPGDADCSGTVNSIDAAFVLQVVAGLLQSLPCPGRADVDGRGQIDAIDAALILQISAGLLS